MIKFHPADIEISQRYRQILSSFIGDFLNSKVLLFAQFKRQWQEEQVFQRLWALNALAPAPEPFVALMLDGGQSVSQSVCASAVLKKLSTLPFYTTIIC
jgi:hypothetical protein